MNFKKIKSVGGQGFSHYQFNRPFVICYKKNKLYICNYANQRIQIFKKKLQFVQSLKVEYEPWVMKLSNSIMFVQSGNSHYYYTYDLDNLTLFYYKNEKFKEELALNNNLRVYCFGFIGWPYYSIKWKSTDN